MKRQALFSQCLQGKQDATLTANVKEIIPLHLAPLSLF